MCSVPSLDLVPQPVVVYLVELMKCQTPAVKTRFYRFTGNSEYNKDHLMISQIRLSINGQLISFYRHFLIL